MTSRSDSWERCISRLRNPPTKPFGWDSWNTTPKKSNFWFLFWGQNNNLVKVQLAVIMSIVSFLEWYFCSAPSVWTSVAGVEVLLHQAASQLLCYGAMQVLSSGLKCNCVYALECVHTPCPWSRSHWHVCVCLFTITLLESGHLADTLLWSAMWDEVSSFDG